MIASVLTWLRARWHALAISVSLLLIALVWARRQGRLAERERSTAANRDALGESTLDDLAAERRRAEREVIQAQTEARIRAETAAELARTDRTTADADATIARLEARRRARGGS
jgi:hypothetical protein